MDNRTLYFGSTVGAGLGDSFPTGNFREREPVEVFSLMVQNLVHQAGVNLQFALIEMIEFQDSGNRRSSSIVFSALPDSANRHIIGRHYDIIRDLKQEPGMDWSLLGALAVQFGPTIFCLREPHDLQGEKGLMDASPERPSHWSTPITTTLDGNYPNTDEPDDARVMSKLQAYAKRVTLIWPVPVGVLHVLVVPFSVHESAESGKTYGAACILLDTSGSIPDDVVEDIYTKVQLFWLRFYTHRSRLGNST